MSVRQWLERPVVVLAALVLLGGERLRAAEPSAAEARMLRDITFLASDLCEGRGVTTKGINLAADYIANEFKKAGLKPAGVDNAYFQPFTINGEAKLESPNVLVLRGPQGQEITLPVGSHFQPFGLAGSGKVTAPVVFVGYGATAKEIGYDDYQGVDVAGKVVMILRKTPRPENAFASFNGRLSGYHSTFTTKIDNAEQHKAAAILFVNDRDSVKKEKGDRLMPFNALAFGGTVSKLPIVHLRRAVADTMLQASLGAGVTDLECDIDRELKPQSAPLTGWTATLEVRVKRTVVNVKNVLGVREGKGPHAKETVIIGAHYDHLGYGGRGSLAGPKVNAIHHGADDNGSGTTALLELARRFGGASTWEGRRLLFITFSGEESGLLGSEYYCKHPLIPLADTVTMVNMDMVGRLRPDTDTKKDKLIVYGTGTAANFDQLIEHLNKAYDFKLQKIPGGMGPSDHASFYAQSIPVFFFFTGMHADYHRPSDTSDKINVEGMRRVADLVENLVNNLASMADRPKYVKVAGGGGINPGVHGPRMGIRPSYGDDKEGVLLDGVADGGPAAKAGLKAGDRITEIGGKPVKNLENYMVLLAAYKKGDVVEVGILRDAKKMMVKVKPE
jgi:hypothetical protein